MTGLTALGLVALVFYTFYTRQMVIDAEDAARQQTIDIQKSFGKTDEALAAANRLANAAAQSANESRQLAREAAAANAISQEALVGVQRAFMFPKGVDLEQLTDARATGDITGTKPVAWIARVKWENSGNTPTRNLTVAWRCLYSFDQINDPWGFVPKKGDKSKGLVTGEVRSVFGPKQTEYAGACGIPPIALLLHQLGAYNYYVFGIATYNDVLSPKRVHRTEFCYALKITGNIETGWRDAPSVAPLTSEAYACQKHNCADEECANGN